jgi:hypothetical protein
MNCTGARELNDTGVVEANQIVRFGMGALWVWTHLRARCQCSKALQAGARLQEPSERSFKDPASEKRETDSSSLGAPSWDMRCVALRS